MTKHTDARGAQINQSLMLALHSEIVARGHNITTAAELCGVSQQQMSRWIRGDSRMKPDKFVSIVQAIGGDPAKVFARGVHMADMTPESFEEGKRPPGAPDTALSAVAAIAPLSAFIR